MKRNKFMAGLLALFLCSCSEETVFDPSAFNGGSGETIELALNQQVSGKISRKGEVDNYFFRAIEANNILKVRCTSNTLRPEVDLLVTVYRLDENGKKDIMYAKHAREGSLLPADILMNIFIEKPQDIYISVRDLNDDEFSTKSSYYLSVDFGTGPEGNDTFSGAEQLLVDAPESCKTNSIGYIGDVDVYEFTAKKAGVFNVQAEFSQNHQDSDVDLSLDLYDANGILITSLAERSLSSFSLLPFLDAGKYYLLVDDYGKDDFDTASEFTVCVNSVASEEPFLNDTRSNASDPGDISSISGSLDYLGDKDWYRVSVPANQTGPSVIYLEFDDSLTSELDYLVRLVDPDDNVLLSHVFRGRSGRYSTRIKVPPGDNYFVVEPAGGEYITEKAPYSASITIVSDADEGEGVGNDINDAVMVKSGEPVTGKIAFRGDEDWYKVSVDRTNAQILELFFDAGISDAEYDVQIMRDDVVKRVFDANGGDSPTSLSTSIFIPADGTSGNATYLIKVADYQGDNGDNVQYTLQVNLVSVPGSLPAPASSGHVGAFYYHEVDERQDSTRSLVDLISNAITRKDFPVNTTLLDPSSDKAIITPAKGGTSAKTTIEFPWIAGYVDYQGDQDWFQLPNSPFYEGDTKWYYDIKVDIHADAPGSVVEYVWRFYPDRNNNRRLMLGYSTSSDDGIIASAGDLSTEREGLDVSVPGDGQKFWVGDKWEGNSFFSISDFNYAGTPGQEDDWGYDVPYYFKVTLTYYPGKSYPGDE